MKRVKKVISIFLIGIMMVSNIHFLYAENIDGETTKVESIEEVNYESEDLATQSQIELSEEKKEEKQDIKEEPEEDQEASPSEIEQEEQEEQEEKEEVATSSEIEREEKE